MKLIIGILALLLSFSVYAQKEQSVFLKWKLQPKEILSYKTAMQEIDTTQFKGFSFNFNSISTVFGDSMKIPDRTEKLFQKLNKMIQEYDLISYLSENKKGIIDIEMVASNKTVKTKSNAKTKDEKKMEELEEMMQKMSTGAMLRGAVTDGGAIQSFYVKNDQRNLLSIFFELPNKEIKVGDSWALDVHLIAMDQHFKCDSAYKKNDVTLIELSNTGTETIATLKYTLVEYVTGDFKSPMLSSGTKTTMLMTHHAIAKFSIEKGRWISYEGIMSLSSSGVMSSNTNKKLSLIPN